MTRIHDPEVFFAALENACADPVTLSALADWYEEQGDPAANCLRELLRLGIRPGSNPDQTTYGPFFWELREERPILDDPAAQLPAVLWEALQGNDEPHPVYSFKSYRSPRTAYLALLDAWRRVGPVDLEQPTTALDRLGGDLSDET